MTDIPKTNTESQNSKEILPPGIKIIDQGQLSIVKNSYSNYKWIKVSYNEKDIDLPLIKDGRQYERLMALVHLIEKSQEIHQNCKADRNELLAAMGFGKDCLPYAAMGSAGTVNMMIDTVTGDGDSSLIGSAGIRDIIGLSNMSQLQADEIITELREIGKLPFDPNSQKEENSFAKILATSLHGITNQEYRYTPPISGENSKILATK